jgi:hypothetical protein
MLGPIFQCCVCQTIFRQVETIKVGDRQLKFCPRDDCNSPELEFDHVMRASISGMFMAMMGNLFNRDERDALRGITEVLMEPFNPVSRDL